MPNYLAYSTVFIRDYMYMVHIAFKGMWDSRSREKGFEQQLVQFSGTVTIVRITPFLIALICKCSFNIKNLLNLSYKKFVFPQSSWYATLF